MIEDKERWNKKYADFPMPSTPSPLVLEYLHHADLGQALDIACGTGRNSTLLAEQGFFVDAVDISDNALAQIPVSEQIRIIEADLDAYEISKERYDLIVNCNYLDRRLFPAIKAGLRDQGLLIFETFVEGEGEGFHRPSDSNYLLGKEELREAFSDLDIIEYEERVTQNLRGEKVRVASLVARKRLEDAQGSTR